MDSVSHKSISLKPGFEDKRDRAIQLPVNWESNYLTTLGNKKTAKIENRQNDKVLTFQPDSKEHVLKQSDWKKLNLEFRRQTYPKLQGLELVSQKGKLLTRLYGAKGSKQGRAL